MHELQGSCLSRTHHHCERCREHERDGCPAIAVAFAPPLAIGRARPAAKHRKTRGSQPLRGDRRASVPHPDPRSKRARLHLRSRRECPMARGRARHRFLRRIRHRNQDRKRDVRRCVRQAKTLDISAISGVSQHIRAPDRVKRAPRDLPVGSRVSASHRVIVQAPSVPAVPREARLLPSFGRSRTQLASNLPPADAIAGIRVGVSTQPDGTTTPSQLLRTPLRSGRRAVTRNAVQGQSARLQGTSITRTPAGASKRKRAASGRVFSRRSTNPTCVRLPKRSTTVVSATAAVFASTPSSRLSK